MKFYRATAILLGACLAMTACASSRDPSFHSLVPKSGAVSKSEPLSVELRRPSLPSYLDRPQVVRRDSTSLELDRWNHWGAPLEEMVGATLAENLAQRLPNSSVFIENGSVSSAPDVVVEVDFSRLESTGGAVVELSAQVAVHWRSAKERTTSHRYTMRAELADSGASEIAEQTSSLLARLSDAIAQAVVSGAASAPVAGQPQKHGTAHTL